jgi:hypothetical protein
MVRMTKLERVNERIMAEGGVRKGLGEKLIAFCEIGLVGYSVLRRGLIETQRLFCFYAHISSCNLAISAFINLVSCHKKVMWQSINY